MIPASVQLADKSKTGCNSIQFLQQYSIESRIYTWICPLIDQQTKHDPENGFAHVGTIECFHVP